jgi:hypothetical protein
VAASGRARAQPDLLTQLASIGEFFAVRTHSPQSQVVAPWRAMTGLVDDPRVLPARVLAVRDALSRAGGRAVSLRVAASVTQLGLSARLVAPALAVAALTGRGLELDLARLRWQPELGGAVPLSVPIDALPDGCGATAAGDPGELAAELARVLSGPVARLVDAARAWSVSPLVLWGNVASAVHGATGQIASARPAHADRAKHLAALLQAQPPLLGTGRTEYDGRFRRSSCCLFYRVAGSRAVADLCGDCVLVRSG